MLPRTLQHLDIAYLTLLWAPGTRKSHGTISPYQRCTVSKHGMEQTGQCNPKHPEGLSHPLQEQRQGESYMGPGTAATLGESDTEFKNPNGCKREKEKPCQQHSPTRPLLLQPQPLPSLTFFFCLCRARLAALALFKGLGSVLLM